MSDVAWYTERFWEGLADGVFRLGDCPDCERAHFPPSPVCPHCGSEADWTDAEGRGTLYSFTRQHRTAPGFEAPATVGLVELVAGPRVLMRLDADYDDLEIGLPVEVACRAYEEEYDRGRCSEYPTFAARPE